MPENSTVIVQEISLDEELLFSLVDVCDYCHTGRDVVIAMISEGIAEPEGRCSDDWRFSAPALRRMQRALRLQRDLRVNLAGAALVLDLLDELETLRRNAEWER